MQANIQTILTLLQQQSTLVLATADSAGAPHSTPLFYFVHDDLRLYWFSSGNSRHSRNCAANPAASIAVYRETNQWQQIRGVQMRGEVAAVTDRALRSAIREAYCRQFALSPLFSTAIRRSTLYCFTPSWARYLDNSVRFGYRFEVAFPAPGRATSPANSRD